MFLVQPDFHQMSIRIRDDVVFVTSLDSAIDSLASLATTTTWLHSSSVLEIQILHRRSTKFVIEGRVI